MEHPHKKEPWQERIEHAWNRYFSLSKNIREATLISSKNTVDDMMSAGLLDIRDKDISDNVAYFKNFLDSLEKRQFASYEYTDEEIHIGVPALSWVLITNQISSFFIAKKTLNRPAIFPAKIIIDKNGKLLRLIFDTIIPQQGVSPVIPQSARFEFSYDTNGEYVMKEYPHPRDVLGMSMDEDGLITVPREPQIVGRFTSQGWK